MPRMMIVTKTVLERRIAASQVLGAYVLCASEPDESEQTLRRFSEARDGVLICTEQIAITGFRVPAGTLILCGPNIEGGELVQVRARAARSDPDNTDA